jgi:hypothetical protein
MQLSKEVLVAIIGAVPAIAAPPISWLLQHRGDAQKAREVEALERRVQLIERLLALEKHLSDERKKMLQAELAHIAEDLVADRARERAAGETVVEGLPKLRRLLLLYDQPTARASVYRALFWILVGFPLFGAVSVVSLPETTTEWPVFALGMSVYLVVGLLFRSAAVRQQKRARAVAARGVTGEPGGQPVVPVDTPQGALR